MGDGPEWFAPKRYGFGTGLPISWQGWLTTAAFSGIAVVSVYFLSDNKPALLAAILPVTALFIVVCWKTTRGGWRWRWGKDD